MNIPALQELLNNLPNQLSLHQSIQAKKFPIQTSGLIGSSASITIAQAAKQTGGFHIVVCNDKDEAAYYYNTIQSYLEGKDIWFFPDSFKMPLKFGLVNPSNVLLRAETISNFLVGSTRYEILITYPEALVEKCVGKTVLKANSLHLEVGASLDIDFIIELLAEYGFSREDFVYSPGQFAVRGGIIDVFSFAGEKPYRIELFGDEVETIRSFDPETQLSEKSIKSFTIVPNIQTHFGPEQLDFLFNICPEDSIVWMQDQQFIEERIQIGIDKAAEFLSTYKAEEHEEKHPFQANNDGELGYCRMQQAKDSIQHSCLIEFGLQKSSENGIEFHRTAQPVFNRQFDMLADNMRQLQSAGYSTVISSQNPKQIERLERIYADLDKELEFDSILLNLHEGFVDHDLKIAFYTDHQIFNRYHKYQIKQAGDAARKIGLKLLTELKAGDYVTHMDHGVGQFMGLEKLNIDGKTQEAVRLKYKDGDLLYVSINSLHKISRFSSEDGKVPTIHKLGTDTWENLKKKTKRKVKDIAKELIALYAKRKAKKGFQFGPDSYLQTELEASFLYEDTPDQATATADVKADMESERPMDRLVCGDVGFGKTEIAIRAAFKALQDGKQVAILVPTTILAMQHERTFRKRMEDFKIRVESINRFKTAKQKKEILHDLKEGKVEILVGTHAILSKQVEFKDLGLMIVDEEQKFGVSAKEKLKNIKLNVDTLTLTATPIPRTLQFSLMGARDLSVINTPPPNRQPIHTEVHTFNDEVLRDAIFHEYDRGGQVFFIHNRVKDIYDIGAMVKKLCPDVEVGIAHGQLDGKELEEQMFKFMNGEYDVLLATNIIETGLDIANANTIIINNAHHFGLSDLHQLRGRVGRSNTKAFCYLFAPPIASLPTDSKKRLQTIEQFSDLGSGFQIAMKDLDIRGAGNMLGGEQSGFITDIGFEAYNKILDEAIQELKEDDFKDVFEEHNMKKAEFIKDCNIESDTEFHIPDQYVSSIQERLSLYTRISNLKNEESLEKFKTELIDRFGPIPTPTHELFEGVKIQWEAKKLGIERINVKNGLMICSFVANPKSAFFQTQTFTNILSYVARHGKLMKLKHSPQSLRLIINQVTELSQAKQILADMADVVVRDTADV